VLTSVQTSVPPSVQTSVQTLVLASVLTSVQTWVLPSVKMFGGVIGVGEERLVQVSALAFPGGDIWAQSPRDQFRALRYSM
jgi:hypothetical protein